KTNHRRDIRRGDELQRGRWKGVAFVRQKRYCHPAISMPVSRWSCLRQILELVQFRAHATFRSHSLLFARTEDLTRLCLKKGTDAAVRNPLLVAKYLARDHECLLPR